MEILNELLMLVTLVVGGTVAIVAFLRLATFSQGDRATMRMIWSFGGVFFILFYLVLKLQFSLSGPIIILLTAPITGLPV
ncbi:MAG: hypothetical protein SXV54_17360, partial [Chloroflexota bacterium]|nr:hypothetical protein [Chloroflexota bacterium]